MTINDPRTLRNIVHNHRPCAVPRNNRNDSDEGATTTPITHTHTHTHTYPKNIQEEVDDVQVELYARLNILVIIQLFQQPVRIVQDVPVRVRSEGES